MPLVLLVVLVPLVLLVLSVLGLGGAPFAGASFGRPFPAAAQRGRLIVAIPGRPAPVLNVGPVDRTSQVPDPLSEALARDLGLRTGMPVELRLMSPAAAHAALRAQRVDVAVEGSSLRPEHGVSYAPTSYAGGFGRALALRRGPVRALADLAGRPVCVVRGTGFYQAVTRARALPRVFDKPLDAMLAFMAGECAALVDDHATIDAVLHQASWRYYAPLPGRISPAQSYVAFAGADPATQSFVARSVHAWQGTGLLRRLREARARGAVFELFVAENDLFCH